MSSCRDLTGQDVGAVTVLGKVLNPPNKKNAYWHVKCRSCSAISVMTTVRAKRSKHGCQHCFTKNRVYKTITTECQVCGTEVKTESRHPNRYCSPRCRNEAVVARSLLNRRASVEGTLAQITTAAKSRAKRKGIACDIDIPYMQELLRQQSGLCAKTGRELEPSVPDGAGLRGTAPNVISIDRIDSSLGYVRDNVQLVCYMYNVAKNKFGELDLIELAEDVLTNAGYFVRARRAEVHE